jgi:aryl-alcohol dehydrogenase-like predicted oxidoreductase
MPQITPLSRPSAPLSPFKPFPLTSRSEGKIKYIGLSEIAANTLRRACKIAPVNALQIEYSAFERLVESPTTNLFATCRELGVSLVAYSPLGRGLLTGALSKEALSSEGDLRTQLFPRFSQDNFEANLKVVNQFKAMADKKGCTTGQLAIAWLLKQGDNVIPIPGTKRIKYLEENWGSLQVNLTDADEAEIRKFVEEADIAGGRLPDWAMSSHLIDTKLEA